MHGQWESKDATFEERLVALADHLWKGKRDERLENLIIEAAAGHLEEDRWQTFLKLDPIFEEIASHADEQLAEAAGVPPSDR